ncbi:FAD-dependent oxidoreductase [Burkholderia pseudomultivorans]|uniref:FAD-dependent oxidoreductase n=1 Tax=Burkholderia pseudomultivorans TaxID=1207504 RepID=UPI000757402F|nr:FAD-dependent oxidoreductase [Burkholderia pseudomultivorans]KVG67530.1 FAD-dependent oxidoreductase [Burkholderia pseudomultivorans]
MSIDYQTLKFEYRPRAARGAGDDPAVHPVIVVGAGPVGLSAAIDLAQQGVPVVLLDDDDTLSTGSRAICFAKRTLEIFDRLGCGERFVDKGVSWHVGKVFLQDEQLYAFDLLPEQGHARPAFINLQQYYVEGYLAERAFELPNIDIRWKHKVTGVEQSAGHAVLTIETPEGVETLRAQYVVAADGSRSPLRAAMGLESRGRTFKDRFLIADVKMKAEFPTERWFWFDPPFHRNQSVLLHRQPDNVWRIDFQLGWDADPVAEKQPERVIPRVRALLGPDVEFELEWVSVYTFRCQRMDTFRHGRVLFAGDSAHGVSPFGARGANSGVQDADNLAWKLKLVLDGSAPDRLLDTYASEREFAADENIRNSTRSTDFITPKSPVSRVFRDATLKLARDCEFARKLVNSGRLSVPAVLADSPLNTPDRDTLAGAMRPGAAAADAPVRTPHGSGWLLQHLRDGFTGVLFGLPGDAAALAQAVADLALPVRPVLVVPAGHAQPAAGVEVVEDIDGVAAQRYDAKPGTFYLLRPDQHVCARMRALDRRAIADALARATCAH